MVPEALSVPSAQASIPCLRDEAQVWPQLSAESPPGTPGQKHVSRPGGEPEVGTIQPSVPARHFIVLSEVALESGQVSRASPASFLHIVIPIPQMRKLRLKRVIKPTHRQDEAGM